MSRQCRSKVELIQLDLVHEKYGVWTRPYFSCAEPNWISSTLERHWRNIWFRRRTVCRTWPTGNPGSVIVPQYGSSKNTVFVWGKNIAWVSGVSGEKEKDGSEKGREVEGGFGQMMYRSPERSPQDSRDGIFCTVPRPHFLGRALIWPGCFGEHILGLFGLYPSSLSKSVGFVSLSGKA